MNASLRTAIAVLVAGAASMSPAHASLWSPSAIEHFKEQNQTLQQESTSMPAGSPAVDHNAKPADPIPVATGLSQEEALFKAENHRLQSESTGMPARSPPVHRHQPAFDPMPNPQHKAQRLAANLAEERFLQQESTK